MSDKLTDSELGMLRVLAEIREALGVYEKPMLDELPGIVRTIVRERNALLANVLAYRKHCREDLSAGPIGDPRKHIEIDKRFDELIAEHDRRIGIAALNDFILAQDNPIPREEAGAGVEKGKVK